MSFAPTLARGLGSVVVAAVLFGLTGCGDDDGDDTSAGSETPSGNEEQSADDGAASGSPGGGGGGVVTIGSETIELDRAQCYLQPQDAAAGGGTIEYNAQGKGTDAEGNEVLVDLSRYSEESQFAGDDAQIEFGPPAELLRDYAMVDGSIVVEGSTLTITDATFRDNNDGSEAAGSVQLDC